MTSEADRPSRATDTDRTERRTGADEAERTERRTAVDDADGTGQRPVADDPAAATDTFTLLSNETRVRIVVALDASEAGLRFSELRARVGVRDAGRFNYHLERLRGRLVTKSDDGYVLTPAGERAASLV